MNLTVIGAVPALSICLMLAAVTGHCASQSKSGPVSYPVPDGVKNSPYVVNVDGEQMPIESAGEIDGAYYTRFQIARKARVRIALSNGSGDWSVKPRDRVDRVKYLPGSVEFDVLRPGAVVVTSASGQAKQWPLIVIAEHCDKSAFERPKGPRVFDVTDYTVGQTGLCTTAIQKALDECAAVGGGTVYFAPGIYRTGTIRVKSNTAVVLAPGALIISSDDPADLPVDEGREEQGEHGKVCSFSRLIMFDHAENSSITGFGVIDGRGTVVRNRHRRHVQLIDVTASRNIRISDVVLRNSAEWTLHILGSENVTVNDLKIINDWAVANTDGIDPDGSRNVFVNRYFGFCGDDAVAVKTTGNSDLLQLAENIVIRDSLVMTRKTAFKVGTETYADIKGIEFRDCEAVNSARGIGLWMRDGAKMSNVSYRGVKLDLTEIDGEGMSGEPIRATIEARHGPGVIDGVIIDRMDCHAPYASLFAGMPESNIRNVKITDSVFRVKPRTIKNDRRPLMSLINCSGFVIANVKINWPSTETDLWDGVVAQKDCNDVVVEGLTEQTTSTAGDKAPQEESK
jgi:hypothetical protein